MRREDVEKMGKPYENGTPPDFRLFDALGISLANVRVLESEVLKDLDPKVFGIGWWAPHPGTSRRILISDQLLQCVSSIEMNLLEAQLHLLELLDCGDQEDEILANVVSIGDDGKPKVTMPDRLAPRADLPPRLRSLHSAGFFRAIGSALDCLGGAIVGVLAVKTSILKADFEAALRALDKIKTPNTNGESLQASSRDGIRAIVAAAGPNGWLGWTVDYRNMLVHRGRRLQLSILVRRPANPSESAGPLPLLARAVEILAQDPALSDVEAFLSTFPPLLTEDAQSTLNGVMSSALVVADKVAELLLSAWQSRRATPALLEQPKEQWKDVPSNPSRAFVGYAPGSQAFNATQMTGNPTLVTRLRAAALDDQTKRAQWSSFD